MKFFTKEEREKISLCTREVESRTAGEIAVMVVERSERYKDAEVAGGFLAGGLLALVLTVFYFHSSLWWYVFLNFICFIPGFLLFRKFAILKSAFVGPRRREEAVRERALRAFYEKGLYRTKDKTGVLFFLSLLERKVWVLADKGIHEKITQERLNKFAAKVSKGMSSGQGCESLCEAIHEAGDLLAKHFPKKADDIDELPNDVLGE